MKYWVGIMLVIFLAQCKSKPNTDLCEKVKYVIDTSGFELGEAPFLKEYYANGSVDFIRLYEDSVQKDLCRFYSNGYIAQYVFFNEACECPRFIINYDSTGCMLDSFDGKPAYFKSEVFGKIQDEGKPYSVYMYAATPPEMMLKFSLFASSDNRSWKYLGQKEFANGKNSIVIADTVSKIQRYFMGVCDLASEDGKEILSTDTMYYSLNTRDSSK